MTEDIIIEKLNSAIQQRAKHYNVNLGAGADIDIKALVSKAAKALVQDQARIPEAEKAFQRLIDEMVASSKQIANYPPGVIGEETLAKALAGLCPIFPIC